MPRRPETSPRERGSNAPTLAFHGAAHTVTGSCFLLSTGRARVLVDCGMFQGSKSEKELNYRAFPFEPRALDAVVLTHAHIDHSGLLPKLVKAGYAGPVFATPATIDLCSVMLPDSGYIQEMEVAQLNRRNARRGRDEVEPIYTAEDAVACLTQFHPAPYATWTPLAEGVRARFWNAGHLLGSASVEIEIEREEGAPLRVLFSGDIGPDEKLLQHAAQAPQGFDYIVCESTYGDTDREAFSTASRRARLRDVVMEAQKARGALLIPSFAVERTQELLVDLVALMEAGDAPEAPIFIDSPLATKASAVFARHAGDLADGGALARAMNARHVRFTESVEQSKAIGRFRGFHIVLAASGMCEAGRIRHHLKAWLWRPEGTVLLVGYQAQGTLGRILQSGASRVRIQGEDIQVRARIRSLDLYSGHADGPELATWLAARGAPAHDLFLVHGEQEATDGLAARLAGRLPSDAVVRPRLDDVYRLTGAGARLETAAGPPRLDPARVARLDSRNDLARLMLSIGEAMDGAADERARAALVRKLQRALDDAVGR